MISILKKKKRKRNLLKRNVKKSDQIVNERVTATNKLIKRKSFD